MDETNSVLSSTYKSGVRFSVCEERLLCHAAQGALSVDSLGRLRKMKPEIIALLRQAPFGGARPTVHPRRSLLAPLSAQQESWGDVIKNPTKEYSLFDWATCIIKVRGALDVGALRKSVLGVVQRHGSLRTRIGPVGNTFAQVIDEPVDDLVRSFDVSGDEANSVLKMFFERVVDLAAGPLFETALLRLGPSEHVLAVLMHHIISDGVSLYTFIHEVWTLYDELVLGSPSVLSDVPMQYADYASWQKGRQSSLRQHNDTYWDNKLSGAVRVHLPTDGGLENAPPFSITKTQILFDIELSRALRQLAKERQVAVSLVVLSIYLATMVCWSGQRDFVTGLIVDGRNRAEHVGIIGLFAHGLPLRVRMTGNERFGDLLKLVADELFGSLEHIELFETIELCGSRIKNPELLEGSCFNWLSALDAADRLSAFGPRRSGITVEAMPVERVIQASYRDRREAVLVLSDAGKLISGVGKFRADLFSPNAIAQFVEDFRLGAQQVVRNPWIRVSDLVKFSGGRRTAVS